jgi:hypothetical protein
MAVPLRVGVTPDRADVQPGEALAASVSVRNTSDVVEHYGVELLGLPEHTAARVEPDVLKLRPGETGTSAIRLTLGADPPATAGSYTVGVLVRSRYREEISRCEELAVNVAVVQQIALRVDPEVATGKRSAKYKVQVYNGSNVPVRLMLAATDPQRRVKTRFNPPMLGLYPGDVAETALAVRAPVPWNREMQRPLKLEAGGDGAYGAAPAAFLQRPRFASKLAKVAGALGALAVLVAAILGAAVISKQVQPPWQDKAADQAPTTPPTAATGGPPTAAASPPASPSAPGQSSPAAGSPSAAASSAGKPPGGVVEVDLTKTGPGRVDSDAYRTQGLILGGAPDGSGDPSCTQAKSVAVRGEANALFLTASLPDKPDTCNSTPVMIQFINKAARVELVYATPGDRVIQVTYKDFGRTTVTGSAVQDDGSHGGIDFIVVGAKATGAGPPPPAALKAVKFVPLG